MLTSPLDLKSHLHPPQFRMNVVPFINVLLIAFCIFMLGGSYITAPGVSIDLPKATHLDGRRVVSVLTIRHDNMLIYEGRIFTLAEFKNELLNKNPIPRESDAVLLVKLNKDVAMQSFLDLCDIVRVSGYSQIQVATEVRGKL
jgi:biopolymer transport protein ExbD